MAKKGVPCNSYPKVVQVPADLRALSDAGKLIVDSIRAHYAKQKHDLRAQARG